MKSMVRVKRRLAKDFGLPPNKIPGVSTIRYIVNKFIKDGDLNHMGKGRSGGKKTTRVRTNIEHVQQSVADNPRMSCRRRSQLLGLCRSSVHRILRKRKVVNMETEWFQQDGATPHAAIATLDLLRQTFGERLISRRTDNPWSPHSPDLNPFDSFYGALLRFKFTKTPPRPPSS